METVDFYPQTFAKIPYQDNPAFGEHECLMIVSEENDNSKQPHAVVLHIVPDPIESVTYISKFWQHKKAVEYCDML